MRKRVFIILIICVLLAPLCTANADVIPIPGDDHNDFLERYASQMPLKKLLTTTAISDSIHGRSEDSRLSVLSDTL